MDYSIAFIVPGIAVAKTVAAYLERLDLHYPVLAASTNDAVEQAKSMLPKGLKLVISYGLTMMQIGSSVPVLTLELPYSGLDIFIAVSKAVSTPGRKIIHVGTQHMYHYIQRSLEVLKQPPEAISFWEIKIGDDLEKVVSDLVAQGYNTFIGGFKIVEYANKHSKLGIEFDVGDLQIEIALLNAQSTLANAKRIEEQTELEQAIVNTSSDGTILIDNTRVIKIINPAALELFSTSKEHLIGNNLEEMMRQYHLVESEKFNLLSAKAAAKYTPVIIREQILTINQKPQGSVVSIKSVSEIQKLEYETKKDILLKGLVAKNTFNDILGDSTSIRNVKKLAEVYAAYDSPVLLYGETGTGKELFAQSIHNASSRRDQPFVAINCAALSETLIDSELFGYVKGAFTGANKDGKQGLFELANNGTIFLDEIAEASLALQAKLLRVMQEGEVIRVGGDKVIHVNTRVICATNKDLKEMIREGKFRDDLYYRLCALHIMIPPLRERLGDIGLLAETFLMNDAKKYAKPITKIDPEVLHFLEGMPFYGNVRELKSIAECMVIMSESSTIDLKVLEKIGLWQNDHAKHISPEIPPQPMETVGAVSTRSNASGLKQAERQFLINTLSQCHGNKKDAADLLGINLSTMYRKIKLYGISKEEIF
ncbi:MAG: sigma 54-interacting transcriptional regulator [Clostridia bacterium]|nr:sigma 54-interacting transcriptional regulator [Clostridia bacterium]